MAVALALLALLATEKVSSIRQHRWTMAGLSLVVKRSFNEQNRSVPGTEAAIVARAEEEGGGGEDKSPHSLPVVRSFRAFWRFWMAVPTSSYCRALPAYLQNLWALVKSSGDSWTPPADRTGEKRQPLAAPLLANIWSQSFWGPERFWSSVWRRKPSPICPSPQDLILNSSIS